jgi:uncharacterized damage-inducible protein DinB
MKAPLSRLLRYDLWANRETLSSLLEGSPSPKSLEWMGHIVGAEFLWLARLRGQAAPLAVWPRLALGECASRLNQLAGLWQEFLADDDSGSGAREVSYTNSKGETWTSTVEDILTHVVIHSAYHRGQIASDVRASGGVPAYTDYIHAVRQGLAE